MKFLVFVLLGCCKAITALNDTTIVTWRPIDQHSIVPIETRPAASDLHCALLASKMKWVKVYCFQNNNCQLTNEVQLPSTNSSNLISPCKSNIPIFKFCLTSNGVLMENGTQLIEPDCTKLDCLNGKITIDELPPINNPSSCPSTFLSTNQGCLKFSYVNATWCDARKECRLMGADLFSPFLDDDTAINETSAYPEMPSDVWIGVRQDNQEAPFILVSDPNQPELSNTSVAWRLGQPNGTPSSPQFCVRLFKVRNRLEDKNCDEVANFVCEIIGFRA